MTKRREARQYALMRERIADLRQGRPSIGPVIGDLEALVWALPETQDAWHDRFIDAWSVLEIAYAVTLDRGQPLPTVGDRDIAEALDDLDHLVDEQLPRR